jgi:hypothetical protein
MPSGPWVHLTGVSFVIPAVLTRRIAQLTNISRPGAGRVRCLQRSMAPCPAARSGHDERPKLMSEPETAAMIPDQRRHRRFEGRPSAHASGGWRSHELVQYGSGRLKAASRPRAGGVRSTTGWLGPETVVHRSRANRKPTHHVTRALPDFQDCTELT